MYKARLKEPRYREGNALNYMFKTIIVEINFLEKQHMNDILLLVFVTVYPVTVVVSYVSL